MLQFGCALAGVVLVNINPASRSHEISFILRKSRIKALFLRDKDHRANYRSILEEACAAGAKAPEHVIGLGHVGVAELSSRTRRFVPADKPENAANIQYTSGTTGTPKAWC